MFFFFQAEDGIRDDLVTGVQTCALPIYSDQVRSTKLSGETEFAEKSFFRKTTAASVLIGHPNVRQNCSIILSDLAERRGAGGRVAAVRPVRRGIAGYSLGACKIALRAMCLHHPRGIPIH